MVPAVPSLHRNLAAKWDCLSLEVPGRMSFLPRPAAPPGEDRLAASAAAQSPPDSNRNDSPPIPSRALAKDLSVGNGTDPLARGRRPSIVQRARRGARHEPSSVCMR